MAMSQIMDAMNVISTVGGDAEFGKMFDQYIQKECENQTSQDARTSHEGGDQDQTTEMRPNIAQNGHNNQMYSQMHHQQYQNHGYPQQQQQDNGRGSNMQSNGGNQSPYSQNPVYNPTHTSQQSYQMRSHYPPQMGHGPLQQYHSQQHYYASNGHSGQPNGYMMGPGANHPNPPYPGQMHPSGNHPRQPLMLPVPSGSPTQNPHVSSPGINNAENMNQYGQPGQWPSGGGKVKAKPRAPKKRSSKKGKDPNEPQKPASAYALFFRERQAMIKGQSPNASFGEISKIVASMWDALEPEIKAVYKARTEDAKKDYLQALAAYRASGVATGEQTSQYPSPGGYTLPTYPPSVSPTQGVPQSVPLVQPAQISQGVPPSVPLVQPAQISPGIPPNIHPPQQL